MELVFAHLADYATEDRNSKLIVAGTFDTVFTDAQGPVGLPGFWIVAEFHAHVTEGTEHQSEVRFIDADGKEIIPKAALPLKFNPQGPGRPLRARLFVQVAGVQVPRLGDYSWNLLIDGRRLGGLPLHVVARPAGTQP
jgi:hypothetical protein